MLFPNRREADGLVMRGLDTAIVDEDVKFIDFSPTKEIDEVMANVFKTMDELSA